MIYFDNWSLGMWTYFILHGSYGVLWVIKGMITPDASFEEKVSITCAINAWVAVLGPYLIAGYMVASRQSVAA
jgi:steroid 5-alpha reductase family enzyme